MKIQSDWNQLLIGFFWGSQWDYAWSDCAFRFFVCFGPWTLTLKFGKPNKELVD